MYYLDNIQRSNKLQTKHVERMILPNISQKIHANTFEYAGAEKKDRQKSWIFAQYIIINKSGQGRRRPKIEP